MDSKAKIIKFNVGGARYEVARSLLEAHPETMLTRMASEQWHDNPDTEIFIERDGGRFKYCLDYLRDGKILLPITINKEAVLEDLEYYNVEVKSESVVEYGPQGKIEICSGAMFKGYQDLKIEMDAILDEIEQMEKRRDWLDLAMEVYVHLTQSTLNSSIRRKSHYSSSDISQDEIVISRYRLLRGCGRKEDEGQEIKRVWDSCKGEEDNSLGKGLV